jgi:hypothetical protein
MTVIRAPGAVETRTPTLVPVPGCRGVTDAEPVSGGGGDDVAGAGAGWAVAAIGAVCGAGEQPATATMTTIAAPTAAFNLWAPQAI